jgi:hypothetical protein
MESEITMVFAVSCYILYTEYRLLAMAKRTKAILETLDILCNIAKRTMR